MVWEHYNGTANSQFLHYKVYLLRKVLSVQPQVKLKHHEYLESSIETRIKIFTLSFTYSGVAFVVNQSNQCLCFLYERIL